MTPEQIEAAVQYAAVFVPGVTIVLTYLLRQFFTLRPLQTKIVVVVLAAVMSAVACWRTVGTPIAEPLAWIVFLTGALTVTERIYKLLGVDKLAVKEK